MKNSLRLDLRNLKNSRILVWRKFIWIWPLSANGLKFDEIFITEKSSRYSGIWVDFTNLSIVYKFCVQTLKILDWIDRFVKYPLKTGPDLTWGICLRRDRYKTLKLRIWAVQILNKAHAKFQNSKWYNFEYSAFNITYLALVNFWDFLVRKFIWSTNYKFEKVEVWNFMCILFNTGSVQLQSFNVLNRFLVSKLRLIPQVTPGPVFKGYFTNLSYPFSLFLAQKLYDFSWTT